MSFDGVVATVADMDPQGADHSGQAHLADNAVSQQTLQIQIPCNSKRRLVNRTHTVASLLKKKREGARQSILEIESSVHQIPTILEMESSVNQSRSMRERTIRCALCSETFHWLALLTDHLRRRHGVRTKVQTLQFENMDLFVEWKEKMEVNTKSFYHCRRTSDRKKCKTIYFTCNRSGNIERRPDGVRKRGIKVRGYRKTGNSCPARITLVQSKRQGVPLRVKFFETHVGHDQDVGHLNFPKSTRQSLAAQLLRGIPPKKIIENVRKHNRTGRPYKIPTLRDLLNIRSGFLHVNRKSEFPAEDDDGVDMFVQNSQQELQKSCMDVDISIPDSNVGGNDLHLVSAVTAEHNTTSHQFQAEKVSTGKVESCFSRRQKELIIKFSGLVRSCSKWGELDVIAHHLDTIGPELEDIRRASLPSTLPVTANVSHNATKKQYGRKTIGTSRQISQTNHYSHVDSGAFCFSPPDVVAQGSKLPIQVPSSAILAPIMSGHATRPTVVLQTRTIRSVQPPFPKIIVADTKSHAWAAENNNI